MVRRGCWPTNRHSCPCADCPIQISVSAGKSRYQPREQADLTIRLTKNGQPVVGNVSVSVTDTGQVPADGEPGIDTHLLLTGQLRKPLPRANDYLNPDNAGKSLSINNLLAKNQWQWAIGTPGAMTQVSGMSVLERVQTAGQNRCREPGLRWLRSMPNSRLRALFRPASGGHLRSNRRYRPNATHLSSYRCCSHVAGNGAGHRGRRSPGVRVGVGAGAVTHEFGQNLLHPAQAGGFVFNLRAYFIKISLWLSVG